jgi:hypothetical protein
MSALLAGGHRQLLAAQGTGLAQAWRRAAQDTPRAACHRQHHGPVVLLATALVVLALVFGHLGSGLQGRW